MHIIISGGRGFIGSRLVREMESAGHSVRVWSRNPAPGDLRWDPVAGPPSVENFEGVDAVIHLAGESVAHKWSADVKQKIRDSRVIGTRHLVDAINRMPTKPQVLVCASATGYYGDRGEEELVESSPPGEGFLADVCQEWEQEADRVSGVRLVKIRTGMVLGAGGGALKRMIGAFQSKMGGKLGSGKQWVSWIHMADIVGIYRHAVENPISGVWNGTSPYPVRNEAFTEAFGEALRQPTKLTVPEFALKMMFGEMAEVMLGSQKVIPAAAEQAGYGFRFPLIGDALQDAVKET